MTEKEQALFRKWFKAWTVRLRKLIELNAPECILAHAVVSFYRSACGLMPDFMLEELAKSQRADMRRYVGLCANKGCDNENRRGGDGLCHSCEMKEDLEYLDREANEPPCDFPFPEDEPSKPENN